MTTRDKVKLVRNQRHDSYDIVHKERDSIIGELRADRAPNNSGDVTWDLFDRHGNRLNWFSSRTDALNWFLKSWEYDL